MMVLLALVIMMGGKTGGRASSELESMEIGSEENGNGKR